MSSPSPMPPFARPLDHGIHAIDTGFHRPLFDAAYLIVEHGRAAFVDTGTNHSVPRLLATLDALGMPPEAVDYVIPTHVHLDHAGGVGLLMRHLPAARAVVHPRGARHMVDPSALSAGARAVYGDAEFARSYGEIVPVAADRVIESADDWTIDLAGRPLRFFDTPGHARHHHAIWDERSRGFFTGDTFGLSYREFDTDRGAWLMPTTTPVQFEPEALRASVQRLMAFDPDCMYLTHYGRVGDVQRLGASFLEQLDRIVQIGEARRAAPDRHALLREDIATMLLEQARAHGCAIPEMQVRELLAVDIELNAQGLGVWLDKRAATAR